MDIYKKIDLYYKLAQIAQTVANPTTSKSSNKQPPHVYMILSEIGVNQLLFSSDEWVMLNNIFHLLQDLLYINSNKQAYFNDFVINNIMVPMQLKKQVLFCKNFYKVISMKRNLAYSNKEKEKLINDLKANFAQLTDSDLNSTVVSDELGVNPKSQITNYLNQLLANLG